MKKKESKPVQKKDRDVDRILSPFSIRSIGLEHTMPVRGVKRTR